MITFPATVLPETAPTAAAPAVATSTPTAAFDVLMAAELPAPPAADAELPAPLVAETGNSDQAAAFAAALLWTPAPLATLPPPPSMPVDPADPSVPANCPDRAAPAPLDDRQIFAPALPAQSQPVAANIPVTAAAPAPRSMPSFFAFATIGNPLETPVAAPIVTSVPVETIAADVTTAPRGLPLHAETPADVSPDLPTVAAPHSEIPIVPTKTLSTTDEVASNNPELPVAVRVAPPAAPATQATLAAPDLSTHVPAETQPEVATELSVTGQAAEASESSQDSVVGQAGQHESGVTKRARTVRQDPRVSRQENSAEYPVAGRNTVQDRTGHPSKTFVSATAQEGRAEKEAVGTSVAKTPADMSSASTDRSLPLPPTAVAQSAAGEVLRFELPAATDVQPAARDTVAKVLSVIDAQEKPAAASRRSVALDFDFGGDRLAVRVEFRDGAVRAHFQASSPELRSAIASEWSQAAATRGSSLPAVESEFVTTTAQGSAGFAATGDGAARQQSRQTPDPMPAPVRRFADRPVTVTQAAPENQPRFHQSYTTRHLHTFA